MSPNAPDPAGAVNDAHDSSGVVPGVDHAGLTRWLSTVLRDATPPLEFRANRRRSVQPDATWFPMPDNVVGCCGGPPVGNLLHSAHDRSP